MRISEKSRCRPGAAVVETAMVLSITVLLLFGIFEYCRFIFLIQVAENAARSGARYAVARTADGTTENDVKNYVTSQMAGRQSELSSYTVTVQNVDPSTGVAISGTSWDDAPFGGAIMVRISGSYVPMLPGLLQLQTTIPVTATAMMTSEAN